MGRQIAFSEISDNDLDNHVREILSMTPSSGGRLVEGGLRSRGLHIQRRRIQDSIRRVDPVIRTLRSARTIIRRIYNVPIFFFASVQFMTWITSKISNANFVHPVGT